MLLTRRLGCHSTTQPGSSPAVPWGPSALQIQVRPQGWRIRPNKDSVGGRRGLCPSLSPPSLKRAEQAATRRNSVNGQAVAECRTSPAQHPGSKLASHDLLSSSHSTQHEGVRDRGGRAVPWAGWCRKEAVPVARRLSTAASVTLWHGSMVMAPSVRCLPLYRERFPTLSDHRALYARLSCPVL